MTTIIGKRDRIQKGKVDNLQGRGKLDETEMIRACKEREVLGIHKRKC